MTEFERAILDVLRRSSAPLGWYSVEIRLSAMPLSDRPVAGRALESLAERGLVAVVNPGEEIVRYVLTPEGRVRVLQGTPSERARSSEDMRTRYRESESRPLGNRALARDREERARERRAGGAGNNGGDPGRE